MGEVEQGGAAWSDDADRFSAYLKTTEQCFLLCGETGEQQVHVRFTGPWQGREVVWDCHFVTLDHELGKMLPASLMEPHNFIEIGEPSARGMPLRVCLDLPRIDLPAIRKMIVMIRNYRNLRPGRHAFGKRGINP
ncbi:MAG TPA: hypothetical protein ENK49_11265 [Gammaproteobacteria bacterium]|nr:hypothetical protein [Gammaproteobacteria bacterium]